METSRQLVIIVLSALVLKKNIKKIYKNLDMCKISFEISYKIKFESICKMVDDLHIISNLILSSAKLILQQGQDYFKLAGVAIVCLSLFCVFVDLQTLNYVTSVKSLIFRASTAKTPTTPATSM